MELRINKKQKIIFAFFITLTASVLLFGIRAAAEINWAGLSPKVGQLTVERNPFMDFIYFVEYNTLKVLCELIDMFDNAIKELINMNLYQMAKDSLNIESTVYDIAGIVAGTAMCIAAAIFMATSEKSHLTDFVRGICVCVLLFAGLPTVVSAASNLRAAGVAEFEKAGADGVTVDDDMKVSVETLGEKILANNIYVVGDSLRNNTLYTYADTTDYGSNYSAVYNIDPRNTLPNDEFNAIIRESRPVVYMQTSYSDFSTYDKLMLLDSNSSSTGNGGRNQDTMATLYAAWEQTYDEAHFEKIGNSIYVRSGGGVKQPEQEYFFVTYENEHDPNYQQIWSHVLDDQAYPHRWTRDSEFYDTNEYGIKEYSTNEVGVVAEPAFNYQRLLINRLSLTLAACNSIWAEMGSEFSLYDGMTIQGQCDTFEEAMSYVEIQLRKPIKVGNNYVDMNIFEYLVYKQNLENVKAGIEDESITSGLSYDKFTVTTDEEYHALDKTEKVWRKLLGMETQKMYAYKVRFGYGLILSIVTLICLLFAGVKVASLLFDLYFAEVVAPIAIASDMNANGRAKQVIMNILSCNLCFIAVVLILRLYISVMLKAFSNVNNVLVILFLAVAGAKFVIDGPDLIVKLTGMDAGVKSGLSAIMGVRTAAQIAGGTVRSTTGLARAATGIGKTGGKIAGKAAGAAAGAVSGTISGMASGIANGNGVGGKAASGALGAITGGAAGAKAGGLFSGAGAGASAGKDIGQAEGAKGKLGAAFNNTSAGQNYNRGANNQKELSSANNNGKTTESSASGQGQSSSESGTAQAPTISGGKDGKDGSDGKDGHDGIKGSDGKDSNNNQNKNSNNTANTPHTATSGGGSVTTSSSYSGGSASSGSSIGDSSTSARIGGNSVSSSSTSVSSVSGGSGSTTSSYSGGSASGGGSYNGGGNVSQSTSTSSVAPKPTITTLFNNSPSISSTNNTSEWENFKDMYDNRMGDTTNWRGGKDKNPPRKH